MGTTRIRRAATITWLRSALQRGQIRGPKRGQIRGPKHGPIRGSKRTAKPALALTLVLALAIGATTVASSQQAWADNYPSWDDVAAARNSEAATAAAVKQINSLLAGLQAEAERTQKDSEAKGNIWQEADSKYQAANAKALTLKQQADEANAKATASEQRAGQMAAQLMRAGGGDLTTNLLLNAGNADDLLYGLGMSGKISEQANAIYEKAMQDKNTAQALTDQADVAATELEQLKKAAEEAFAAAQAAATAASDALNAQLDHQAQLQAQLVVLTQNRAATEADYLAGVKARFSADASLEGGQISDSGWARPAGGYITSVYGYSAQYGSNFHKGTDLGAGCGANIYAASSGTVSYAAEGWNGGYGNYIIIDHGNGIQTAYGHIMPGGILVSPGQSVGVGQNIARVGTTGNSTGCHLHFEVRINGATTDPVPYMAGQGITLG